MTRPDTTWKGHAEELPAVPGWLVLMGTILAVVLGPVFFDIGVGANEALQTWSTMFVAVVFQALPFLGLGVLVGAAVSVLLPDRALRAVLPRRAGAAVPVAAVAGVALPGCECGSVPLAARLVQRGVVPPAALAFMLASPAVNPVVLVATAVAFPGQPWMVLARFLCSLLVAAGTGWLWTRVGRGVPLRVPTPVRVGAGTSSWRAMTETVRHDLLHAGGFLVVGAAAAATLNVSIPPSWLSAVAGVPVISVLVTAVLAVLLAVCSEADAFVASSLTEFSSTAKLAFMVVGPAIDVKLFAMQAGTFGRDVALRLAPLTFVLALVSVLSLGSVLV